MAKIAQLIEGNYNILDNIPVINQDLTASGFTPVANTYYRHTGATTDTFTQGVIYLYDTAYHKLGESGGGTTLNKYVLTCTPRTMTPNQRKNLCALLQNIKGKVFMTYTNGYTNALCSFSSSSEGVTIIISEIYLTSSRIISMYWTKLGGGFGCTLHSIVFAGDSSEAQTIKSIDTDRSNTDVPVDITYWNDTEIDIGE